MGNEAIDPRAEAKEELRRLGRDRLNDLARDLGIGNPEKSEAGELIEAILKTYDDANIQKALAKPASTTKTYRRRLWLTWILPGLTLLVAIPSSIYNLMQIYGWTDKRDYAEEFLVGSNFSNSLIIVPKFASYAVPEDTSIHTFWKSPDNRYELQERREIKDKKYWVVTGLKPGTYKVELSFYGIRQKVIDQLSVGESKGQIVELSAANTVGTLQFVVLSKDGKPLKGAYAELYTNENIPVPTRVSETDTDGKTNRLWVGSVPYKGDYYYAKAFYPSKSGPEVGRSDKISVVFRSTDQNEQRLTLIRQ